MAIFHLQVSIVSRGRGQSAIASAAYDARDRLKDQQTNEIKNFQNKKDLAYSEIQLPENAPKKYQDRETLWNAVEKVEKNKNSQLARKIVVALPRELDLEQQKRLVHDYVDSQFVSEGMCADWSIHNPEPDEKHPDRLANPHAHIMLTVRSIKKNGKWASKSKSVYVKDKNGNKIPQSDPDTGKQKIGARGRKMWKRTTTPYNDWNNRENVEKWRSEWAKACNRYLAPEHQIDHRSYKRQGKKVLPTRHEGYYARKIEKSQPGISWKIAWNRRVKEYNTDIRQSLLKQWFKVEKAIESLKRKIKQAKNLEEERIHGKLESLKQVPQETSVQHWKTTAETGKHRGLGEKVQSQTTDDREQSGNDISNGITPEAGQQDTIQLHQQSLSGTARSILQDFQVLEKRERETRQRQRRFTADNQSITERQRRLTGGKHRAEEYQQRSHQSQFKAGERYLRFCSLGGFTKAVEELTARSRHHRQTREQLAFYEDDLDQSLGKHGRER